MNVEGQPSFPTCQVRVVRFYQSCSPPPPPLPPPPPHPPPPPRSPDPSGHSRTSTASSRSQWALPDLNRELQIAVGTAGPQRPDRMPEDMPDGMSDRMPEDMSDRMPEDMPDRMPEDMSDRMPEDMP